MWLIRKLHIKIEGAQMAFRFRRSVRLVPGLRVNFGKRGVSLSSGIRGANVTIGRGGLYGNVGVPGTGMSVRSKLSDSGRTASSQRRQSGTATGDFSVRLTLDDGGNVTMTDEQGDPLPAKMQKIAREQQGDAIQNWLHDQCEAWNQSIDRILNLHLETPWPSVAIEFSPTPFEQEKPQRPPERSAGLLGMVFPKRRQEVDRENAGLQKAYEDSLAEWEKARAEHEEAEKRRRWMVEEGRHKSKQGMEEYLEMVLGHIEWPRETEVSFEVSKNGHTVLLDVDLPEVEDMPRESASVAARGLKINVKKRSDTQIRKEYMAHIHSVAFRVIGEVFAALPRVKQVVCSGYSQRPDSMTGQIRDEYLFSVCVPRKDWSRLHFENLNLIDHVACFESFGIRRDMSKTGVFKPIKPLSASDVEQA